MKEGWLEQGSKATVHLGPIGSVHSSPLIELPRILSALCWIVASIRLELEPNLTLRASLYR